MATWTARPDSLGHAVLLGDDHSESHLNLALVDERRGLLADAEREALASLLLNPDQPDARNLLGLIYAQEGKISRASLVWRDLVRDRPDYQPARINLVVLGSRSPLADADDETAAADSPLRPPSKPPEMSANCTWW